MRCTPMPCVNTSKVSSLTSTRRRSTSHAFTPIPRRRRRTSAFWSWLALFYFDQLSPVDAEGRRRPREDYHYIPSNDGWQHDCHLLAGPYRLFLLHRENARLLLYPPVHQHGAFIYNLGFRRDLITNKGLIEAIDLLYWDVKRNRPKRGSTTESRPGNIRRFITVVQQLDFNYDLHGMRAEEILQLLPPEFDAWKPAPLLVRAKVSAAASVSYLPSGE